MNDHVNVVFSEKPGSKADGDQEHGRNEDGQQVVDDGPAQGHFDDDASHLVDGCIAHFNLAQSVTVEGDVGVVLQLRQTKVGPVANAGKVHLTHLGGTHALYNHHVHGI